MRTKLLLILSLVMLAACSASTSYEEPVLRAKTPLKIMLASDLHLLADELIGDKEGFIELLKRGDGKVSHYAEEIVDALVQKVLKGMPDLLILSGDLSFNGEEKSHKRLAEKLLLLKEAGIRVLVIPGNHDIQNYYARQYRADGSLAVKSVSASDFAKIYGDFGYNTALYRDEDSLSYVSELAEDVWVLMLDTSVYKDNSPNRPSQVQGHLSEATLSWIERCLAQAQEQKITVLSVTHHNLLKHLSWMYRNYTLDNYRDLLDLYKKYGVKLNLSGHMHVPFVSESESVYDIASSALSVYPHHVGIIKINEDKVLDYHSEALDFARMEESRDFFNEVSYRKIMESLDSYTFDDEKKQALAETFVWANLRFFTADASISQDFLRSLAGYKIWIDFEKHDFSDYIYHALTDDIASRRYLELDLGD